MLILDNMTVFEKMINKDKKRELSANALNSIFIMY